jgi:hypothetical protein
MERTSRLRFSWVLPVAQILLCAALLWPWRLVYDVQFRWSLHAPMPKSLRGPTHFVVTPLVPMTPQEVRARELTNLRLIAPQLLNMPVGFVRLGRLASVPGGFIPLFWRSMTWPVLGIFFWWIVGRGIDALLAARSGTLSPAITWAETTVALLVTLFAGMACVSFFLEPIIASEFIFPWHAALIAVGAWTLLGAVTVLAQIVQWRIRRRLNAAPAEPLVAN